MNKDTFRQELNSGIRSVVDAPVVTRIGAPIPGTDTYVVTAEVTIHSSIQVTAETIENGIGFLVGTTLGHSIADGAEKLAQQHIEGQIIAAKREGYWEGMYEGH